MTAKSTDRWPPWRAVFAEFLGTAGLLAVIVGSGIAAERLSPTDVGLQLLYNSTAIALGLAALIVVFQPISGAHFNPVVTLALMARSGNRADAPPALFIGAQVTGGLVGVLVAQAMWGVAPAISTTVRATPGTVLAEVVATAGLVGLILVLVATGRARLAAPAIAAYIFAAIWFTSSTAFANPAVTIGRVITDTFTGIAPWSALWFIAAELLGAALGVGIARALVGRGSQTLDPESASAAH